MIDFLEKMYSYEYFPQILFGSIAVLLILLVIVIFFGKKDEKARKEETKRLELAGLDAFAQENIPPTSLEVVDSPNNSVLNEDAVNTNIAQENNNVVAPDIANEVHYEAQGLINNALDNSINSQNQNNDINQPMSSSIIDESVNLFSQPSKGLESSEIVENNSFMEPDFEIFQESEKAPYNSTRTTTEEEIPLSLNELHQKEENISMSSSDISKSIENVSNNLENTTALPEFNFDELAMSINKELDEINNLQKQTEVIPEKEAVIPEPVDVTPIKEVTKFTPSSVFSSVYVNKEKEVTSSEEIKPILEENVEEEIPIIKDAIDDSEKEIKPKEPDIQPVKPVVTNPFIFDMPAKRTDKNEPTDLSKIDNVSSTTNVPDFSAFQNETYDIK